MSSSSNSRDAHMVKLIDVALRIARDDRTRENVAGSSDWRSDQYKMIIQNLENLRASVLNGELRKIELDSSPKPGLGFSKLADEAGELSRELYDAISEFEDYFRWAF